MQFTWLEESEYNRWVICNLFVTIFLLFLNTKILYQSSDLTRTSDDTQDFIRVSALNPLSFQFWVGYKPPLLPLLIRLLGFTNGDLYDHHLLDVVAEAQLVISVLAWTILAISVCFHLKNWVTRYISFAVILFFSATIDITLWDRLTLSESLSISTFALWMACCLFFFYILFKPVSSLFWRIVLWISYGITTFLYINSRDTNCYFVIMVEILLCLWFLIFKKRDIFCQKFFILTITVGVMFFVSHSYIYNISARWHPVIMDLMTDRLANDPDAVAFFIKNGMPSVDEILSKNQYPDFHTFLNANRFKVLKGGEQGDFTDWFVHHAKRTYTIYLLNHPEKMILESLSDWKEMLLTDNYVYRETNGKVSQRILWITRIFYPYSEGILISFFAVLLGGLFLSIRSRQVIHSLWFEIFALLATLPPLLILIWVGGSLEIPRHAFQLSVQFRLALWLGLLLTIDSLLSWWRTSS